MKDLPRLLDAFQETLHCGAVVWVQPDAGGPLVVAAAAPAPVAPPPVAALPAEGHSGCVRTSAGEFLVAAVPGPRRAWIAVGPAAECDRATLAGLLSFLALVVGQYLQSTLEVEHAASELAERYEEINLLYTISEILGRTVSLDEVAQTILREISETVGAERGAILEHDRVTNTLQAVAVLGANAVDAPPIDVDDPASASALVFRTRSARLVDAVDMPSEAERLYRRGAMLSVPIMWTGPVGGGGGTPLGVVNLSGRRSGHPFTAGDQKLIAAIATQIGTAIQNARLVRASLSQQRLVQEMQLAHDLQMRLLPAASVVAPNAEVAARVVPAESVGGDFYHLFRLGPDRTGVMIGDVSSHGYRAALIMALAMSATSIHAQATDDPGEALGALLGSLREELQSTEMFITTFYAVIDRSAGELRYANTGHPHAFVVNAEGDVERLAALDPPLGMVEEKPKCVARPWHAGRDLLLLFTDGVSDARSRLDVRLGEQAVLDVVCEHRAEGPERILERVFEVLALHMGDIPRRDDLTLVIARS